MTSKRILSLRGAEIRVLAWAFLASLLAKGTVFAHAYSIDDYALYQHQVWPELILSQGRFGQYLLANFLYLIGPGPPHIAIVSAFTLLLTAALFSTLIVRHWGISRQVPLAAIAACMMTTHPFTTTIFNFRYNLIITASAFALMALMMLNKGRSTVDILLKISLFAAALSVYQVILNYALMIILTGCVISLTRYLVVSNKISPNKNIRRLLNPARILQHRNSELLFLTTLGTLLYFVLNKIVLAASGIAQDKRARLISFDDMGLRFDQLIRDLKVDFMYSDTLIPIFTHRLLWALATFGSLGIMYHFCIARLRSKETLGWHRTLPFVVLFLSATTAVAWTVGVNIGLEIWHVPTRVKGHVGVLWACALVVPFYCASKQGRRPLLLIAAVAIASFISVSNGILSDQIRLNTRDRLLANRVLARLEMLPEFSHVDSVAIPAFRHQSFRYEAWLQATRHGGKPAFNVEWARVNILREISGYDLKPADLSEMKLAKRYCRSAEIWPAESSVTIKDRVAIVCLMSPKSRK